MCKRWHRLITTELLRDAEAGFYRYPRKLPFAGTATPAERLACLLRFLRRMKRRVRRLRLSVEALRSEDDAGAAQLAAELQARLGRCVRLEELSLWVKQVPVKLGPWLAPLGGTLRRLTFQYAALSPIQGDARPLRLQPGGLSACTRLESLVLDAQHARIAASSAGCWPAGITSLELHLSSQLQPYLPESVSLLHCWRLVLLLWLVSKAQAACSWQPSAVNNRYGSIRHGV